MADEDERDLSWQKPDWTKNTKLRSTGKGDAVKTGGNLAAPITSLPHQKEPFEKPEWTGDVQAKEGTRVQGDLAKPITALPHTADSKDLSFQKPEWTKDVETKVGTRTAADLAKPITSLPHVEDKKDLSFKKPDWTTNKNLNATKKGAALQEGKEIARAIGGIKAVEINES